MKTDIPAGRLLTVKEAAVALGLKPGTIYQWSSMRRIRTVKLSRKALRVEEAEIARLIEKGRTRVVS